MLISDYIGSFGVFIILLAYFLNAFVFKNKNSFIFYLMNVVGSSIACYASYLIQYFPFVILEACWSIISCVALLKVKSNKNEI